VALGVIFIPMILSTDDEFTISDTNIPAKPAELNQLAERPVPEPVAVQDKPVLEAQLVDEHTPQTKSPAPEVPAEAVTTPPAEKAEQASEKTAAASKPAAKTDKSSSRAWVVQVASFTDQKKALALRDRLRKAKYPSFVESIEVKNTQLFRVRVGPVVSRDNADAWQKKIARDFKLKDALVMAHPG
jgi:DedD protein